MPSKEFEDLTQLIKSFPKDTDLTLQERRSDFEERAGQLPIAAGTEVRPVQIDGINSQWVCPEAASNESVILYLHGGGYCVGSINTHRSLASFIAKATTMKLLLIDYRLAPENPFPAAIEDAAASYRWLLSHDFSPENIVIAGDSAGGAIAVSILIHLKENDDPMPAACVCMSPWVDMEMTGASQKSKANLDIIIQKTVLIEMAHAYIAGANPKDPLVSPIYADLSGLPPMLIQVGSSEVLLDDSKRLALNAEKAGVEVTLDIWEDMIHIFQYFAFMLPEGQEAISKIAAFVQTHTGVD